MKCKKCKENIQFYLYGELNEKDSTALQKHIKACPECAGDLEYTRQVFNLIGEAKEEQAPQPDWEKCWQGIEKESYKKKKTTKNFWLFPNWAYSAAAIIVIFVLGIMAGRIWFTPSHNEVISAAEAYLVHSLKQHLDDLKPLLLEYSNYPASAAGEDMVMLDRGTAQELLIQNILLKKLVSEKYPSAEQLLEDVDIILTEIANQKTDDSQAVSSIKNMIKEREVLFKMEILQTI